MFNTNHRNAALTDNPSDTPEARLDRMDRQLWVAKRGLVLAFLAFSGLVVSIGARQAENTKTIVTQRVILRDDAGKVRAWLALDPEGLPNLTFFDSHGKSRLDIKLGKGESPSLNLTDQNSKLRMFLELGEAGHPMLALADNEAIRIAAGVNAEGSSNLSISSKKGNHIGITSEPDQSGLVITDDKHQPKMGFTYDNHKGSGELRLFDGRLRSRLQATVGPNGNPAILLTDPTGAPLFQAPGHPLNQGNR